MKTIDRQKLDVTNKDAEQHLRLGWRGQFTPELVQRDLREAVSRIFSVQSL